MEAPEENANTTEAKETPEDNANTSEAKETPEDNNHTSEAKATPEDKDHISEVKVTPEDKDHTSEVKATPEDKDHTSEVKVTPEDKDHTSEAKATLEDKDHTSEVKVTPEDKDHTSEVKVTPEDNLYTSKDKVTPVDPTFYSRLEAFKLSESNLSRFNYPRPHKLQHDKAELHNLADQLSFYKVIPGPNKRTCKRCELTYSVQNNGRPALKVECVYHMRRLAKTRRPFYPCCSGKISSRPCKRAPLHVTSDINPNNLHGFLNIQLNNKVSEPGVYALDCEMIFTTEGMDVAAISVVDSECEVVYETLVVPNAPILDYNTEFSELTEKQFQKVTTRLTDVHAKFLTLFGSKTILVGHGLENDLIRLKVMHNHIVDTCHLYPHPKGLPFRRSLFHLKNDYLSSTTFVSGLKCRGDAVACMKLALRKCEVNPFEKRSWKILKTF
ncbi:RNA exonuclease 1 homolog [Homarus americanus]|uniref:RNA exonuclease 1 homolog n=1 Tax=Homarus americanus TaxID=6706 RepID=UPI001C45DF46|nr:RNA exonuclease 1 homolog [Homarus americanus]